MSILNENDSKSLNKDRKNDAEIQDENSGFIQIDKKVEIVDSFERFVITKIVKKDRYIDAEIQDTDMQTVRICSGWKRKKFCRWVIFLLVTNPLSSNEI